MGGTQTPNTVEFDSAMGLREKKILGAGTVKQLSGPLRKSLPALSLGVVTKIAQREL